jgi:hypothetical protein
MSTTLNKLRVKVKTDPLWQRFSDIIDQSYKPGYELLIDEVSTLHKTRSVRVLGAVARPTGKKLADAAMRDQSARSRCVEICMEITRNRNYLATSMTTLSSHINAKYGSFLADQGVRAITERKAIIESLFGKAQRKLEELDTIVEIAQLVIDDVDKAAWAISRTVASLEIAMARERG